MAAVHRVHEFDTWRPKYGAATVNVLIAGTTTLAALFTDEALTVAAANAQVLETFTDADGDVFGKFTQPVYTASAYTLDIDSIDQTGVERPPVTTLVGEDASKATVKVPNETTANDLEDIVARVAHLENYGVLSLTDSSANKVIIDDAIGAVAGRGGGFVFVPAGTIPFTEVTIPTDVVLVGEGRGVTILESQTAGKVVTLGGDRAGLMGLTLDGVDLQLLSVGIFSKANDQTVLSNVEAKRFDTGLQCLGGRLSEWKDLFVSGCLTGAKLHGDNDAGGGADGDEFRNNAWTGGKVDLCSVVGVDFSYEDKECAHNALTEVAFENNLAVALNINGARYTELKDCPFRGNTTNLAVDDDSDVVDGDPNKVIGLHLDGGEMNTGIVTFTGQCQDVILDRMELIGVAFTLTLPDNAILIRDSIEDAAVTISGDGTKFTRIRSINEGASSGLTTSVTPVKSWSIALEPGQVALVQGVAMANQRDGEQIAHYHKVAKIHRPGSDLAYDAQTANFTVGQILTGGTSGATARIVADADSGATGTLALRDIVGVFQNNEVITDPLGGSADANGILVPQTIVIDQADTLGIDFESAAGLDAAFVANGGEIEFQVTGLASVTFEWLAYVRAIVS